MCLIIDANVASLVFDSNPESNFALAFNWLHDPNKNGSMVYGGHLVTELFRTAKVRRYIRALYQSGRAYKIDDQLVDIETNNLVRSGLCCSDDEHVIALARVSGARTLCSHDQPLQVDFRYPQLVNNPRGSIYQRPQHAHLLRHSGSCPYK